MNKEPNSAKKENPFKGLLYVIIGTALVCGLYNWTQNIRVDHKKEMIVTGTVVSHNSYASSFHTTKGKSGGSAYTTVNYGKDKDIDIVDGDLFNKNKGDKVTIKVTENYDKQGNIIRTDGIVVNNAEME